jgi:hypothetical protein
MVGRKNAGIKLQYNYGICKFFPQIPGVTESGKIKVAIGKQVT